MKFSRIRRQFFIFFVDLLILFASIALALIVRNHSVPSVDFLVLHYEYFWFIILLTLLCFYTENMYSLSKYFSFQKTTVKVLAGCTFSLFLGFAAFYLFPSDKIRPQTVLVLYGILSALGIIGWRTLYDRFFHKLSKTRPYIVFGWNDTVREIITSGTVRNYMDFAPAAVYSLDAAAEECPIPVLKTAAELSDAIEKFHAETFILSSDQKLTEDVTCLLFGRIKEYARFYSLPEFYEIINRKIPLGSINEQWVLQNLSIDGRMFFMFGKRVFDIACSLFGLVLTFWLWPFVALVIKAESKGPVFFVQKREGKNGSVFSLLKFRTMKTEQNTYSPTEKNDSRVTKFGNFMRVTRIDELPQLLNVLFGDMSLIGPRPERPELASELEKVVPFYRQRLLVKPGITGWDQVSGEYHSPSASDTYKKIQNDMYYIKNQSAFLEFSIICKTVVTVFKKLGR